MRAILLALAAVMAGSAPGLSFTPFMPAADVPDHVVEMTVREEFHRDIYSRTVTHHRDWTRVDSIKSALYANSFFLRGGATTVELSGDSDKTYRAISIARGAKTSAGTDHKPFSTGERQSWLGEECTVWNVYRPAAPRPGAVGLTRLSCVTDDGIELWYRLIIGSSRVAYSAEATRVARRGVARAEVEPPANLLALDGWLAETSDPTPRYTPDFEIVMERQGTPAFTRTIRRHAGWVYQEEHSGGARTRVSLNSQERGLGLDIQDLQSGRPQLKISQQLRIEPMNPEWERKSRPLRMDRPDDTLVGERCTWFNMSPNMADASRLACRTGDGIALKEEWYGRSSLHHAFVAVRFARRPIRLDELKPPADLLDPKTWSLPD